MKGKTIMTDNMTIGPALAIGGNKVEMTQQGKILVTNPQGKIKTLSQDEFKKQLVKNADKINAGEDFEFKKDNKAGKIAGAAVVVAAITTAAIYRKQIGNYFKNFSWEKLAQDIKNLFKRNKTASNTPNTKGLNAFEEVLSKNEVTREQYHAMKKVTKGEQLTDTEKNLLKKAHLDDENTAQRYTTAIELQTRKTLLKEVAAKNGVTTEQMSAMKKANNGGQLTDAEKNLLKEAHLDDENTIQRYTTAIDLQTDKKLNELIK